MLPSNNPGFYPQILGLPADFLFNQGKSHVQNYGFPSVNSEETMKNKSIYIYFHGGLLHPDLFIYWRDLEGNIHCLHGTICGRKVDWQASKYK
jgi:hypothetical protein